MVIEVDGEIHDHQKDYDEGRTAEMHQYGIEVIRFTNRMILESIEDVILEIKSKIEKRKQRAGAL